MSMLTDILTFAGKEWLDALRDRRALLAALAYAVFGPLVLGVVLNAMARDETAAVEKVVHVTNSQAVPALLEHLEANGYVLADDAALRLDVPADAGQRAAAGRPLTLTVHTDASRYEREVAELEDNIADWSRLVARQRLLARGLVPDVVRPVRLEIADTAALDARGRALMLMLVLFLILAPFFSSSSVAIDVTAGERERGSLESLLALPPHPAAAVAGKWLVTAAVGALGTLLTVAVGALIINRAPLAELGVRLYIEPGTALLAIVALLPLVLLVAAVQLLIALAARSFKEGQTYLTLFSFAPVFAGLLASRGDGSLPAALPVLGEMRLLEQVLVHGTLDLPVWLATTAIYGALSIGALALASNRLGRESILAEA